MLSLRCFLVVLTVACSQNEGPATASSNIDLSQQVRQMVDELCSCTTRECQLKLKPRFDRFAASHNTLSSVDRENVAVELSRVTACEERVSPPNVRIGRSRCLVRQPSECFEFPAFRNDANEHDEYATMCAKVGGELKRERCPSSGRFGVCEVQSNGVTLHFYTVAGVSLDEARSRCAEYNGTWHKV